MYKRQLEKVAACTPALTGSVVKCYGERPASVFFQMDSGERINLECSRGVQHGDAMGPALICLPLRPVPTKVREEYLDDITIAADDILPGTVGVMPFLERELTARGINLNPGNTVALTPKKHVPTPEDISLLAGVGVRIADEGGIKVVGVPGSDEFAIESAMGIVRDGGAEHLVRMLPRLPDKQAANLIATNSRCSERRMSSG